MATTIPLPVIPDRCALYAFGATETPAGVRLPALLCWGGAGLFVYRLTRELYDKMEGTPRKGVVYDDLPPL